MDFDKIVTKLGAFGRYQKLLYFLVCLASLFSGVFTVISAILLATPDHRCKIPGYDNDTYAVQSKWHQDSINRYIPPSGDDTTPYDQCHIYQWENSSHQENVTKIICNDWVYKRDLFTATFTSTNDLVCNNSYKTAFAKSLFFVGVTVGAIILGHISDAFGRKTSMLIGVILLTFSTLSLAWSSGYIFFCVCMVIIGAASEGMYAPGMVIGLELVGPSKRAVTGTVINHFFAGGIVILSGIAYFIRHWKYLEIACAAPCGLFLLYWWLLPESPRWLITKRRYSEAKQILRKAAQVNRVSINEDELDLPNMTGNRSEEIKTWEFCRLLTSKVLLLRLLIISLNMCIITMSYYGLTLNTEHLGGNFYLNFCLSGLVEFPAYTVPLLLMDRVGRKMLYFVCIAVGGAACISTIFPILYLELDYQSITVALAMIGKLGVSAAFAIILVYSAELFPTVARGAALSTCSIFGRIGGVVASYVAASSDLINGRFGRAFPMIVFGVLSLLAAMSALFLPETNGQELPETIEDGILFGTPAYKVKTAGSCVDGPTGENI